MANETTEKWTKKRDRFADSVFRISTSENKAVRKSKSMKWKIRGMVKWSDDYLQNTARSKKVPYEIAKAARTILANRSNQKKPRRSTRRSNSRVLSGRDKMNMKIQQGDREYMASQRNRKDANASFGQSPMPIKWTTKSVNTIYSEVISQRRNFTFKPKETPSDWKVVQKFNKSSLRRMNSIPMNMRGPKHNQVVGQLKGQLTKVNKALR